MSEEFDSGTNVTGGIHGMDEVIHDLEAQLLEPEHEQRMRELALDRFEKRNAKAIKAGRGSTVEPLKGTLPSLLEKTSQLLTQRANRKGSGKLSSGLYILKQAGVSHDVAALIGIRTVLDGVAMGMKLSRVGVLIGARIEDEARLAQLKKREPLLFKRMEQDLKDRGSQDLEFRRKALKRAIDKAYSEEEWIAWTAEERVVVGLEVADALAQHDLIYKTKSTTKTPRGGFHTEQWLRLTPEAEIALAEREELVKAALKPWFKPMLHEPRPWSPHHDGGYTACDVSLVKSHSRQHLESIRQADMPAVYDALNAIQSTPWIVNDDVWFVAQTLFDASEGEAGLPRRTAPPAPVRPEFIPPPGEPLNDEEKRALGEWKSQTKVWHNGEGRRRSKAIQCAQMLSVAEEMRQYREFYFPHQLDYRGRVYPIPLQLNPQGDDLSKGLLTFAKGKKLGTMGGFWLAVHGANTWANDGIDKAPMEDRVDWVVENEAMILAVAEDPLENRWWTEADGGSSPWQFLAFCLEWAGYVESGESPDYVSHLPVGMDGSCNGLQHFSAMLKDSVGARATNLVQVDKPNDIYAQVADRVRVRVSLDRPMPASEREVVGRWLEHGITRDLVKQPVMTTPYGVTRSGMRQQLFDKVTKRPSQALDPSVRAREAWEAINYLVPIVDEAICEVVSASREAMDFLRGLSGACMDADRDPWWVSPSGFPVWQQLFLSKSKRIQSKLLGTTNVTLRFATKKRDRRGHAAALPPNFVHSLDAAHLALTVAAMERGNDEGYSWAMVHDSFGTHAGDIQELSVVLREQFVHMYADTEPLADLVDGLRLPASTPVPEMPVAGDFNLFEVLDAEFFFA